MTREGTSGFGERVRWRVEYGLTLLVAGVLTRLPTAMAEFVANSLGDLLYLLLRKRVRTGRENLRRALPEMEADVGRQNWVLRQSFRHFVKVPVELMRLGRELDRRPPEEIIDIQGRQYLEDILATGGACFYLSGHIGNWEVTGALCERLGYAMTSIGRGVDNPYLHMWLKDLRCRFGQKISDKEGASRDILRIIREGGKVAMLLDQHAGRHGIRVPYFGRLASTFVSAARLARRLGAPLLPAFSYRHGRLLRLRMKLFEPIWPDPELPTDEDHFRLTAYYTACLEQMVRAHPEQYLWFHRRWRPGGQEPEPAWLERYAVGMDSKLSRTNSPEANTEKP